MRFDKPKKLASALDDYLDKFPQKKKLRQGMVLAAFEKVVGKKIAAEARNLHFEGDKLVMTVKHPSWRYEIHASRFSIAKKLNAEVKSTIISEIIVRG